MGFFFLIEKSKSVAEAFCEPHFAEPENINLYCRKQKLELRVNWESTLSYHTMKRNLNSVASHETKVTDLRKEI